jgi:large conductance mechanosensitive channel
MWKEFKEFAMRGNVLDMAVGIVIGAAFGKIVSSFVADILMPPIGMLIGKINFADLFINLSDRHALTLAQAKTMGAPTINYGVFLNTVIDFLIVGFAIFLVVRQINRLKREGPPPSPTTKECPYCAMMIPLKARRCPHCIADIKVGA